MQRIIECIRCNKIKCKNCGDVLESNDVNDFKICSCGKVGIDDGHEYLKRIGKESDYEELSYVRKLVEIITDGFDKVENAISKKDYSFKDSNCPKCKSNNITFEKGDGERILGNDITAIVCHDCEKIYKFTDIKYRS